MTEAGELTLAYLEAHPEDAARVLEHLSPEDASALLRSVPPRLSSPVLRNMSPSSAAQSFELLEHPTAAGLIQGLGPQAGTAILRHLSRDLQETLLSQLPTRSAIAYRLLLAYPEDTVGAWMDPRALALPPETTVEETLIRVRRPGNHIDAVYVVGSNQLLEGVAPLSEVVRAGPPVRLSQIMRPTRSSLPARGSLAAVREHPGWNEYHSLPVVERQNRFVGSLHFSALASAAASRRLSPSTDMGEMLTLLLKVYWLGVSGLIQAAGILMTVPDPYRSGGDDGR